MNHNKPPPLVDEEHTAEMQKAIIDGINAMTHEEIAHLWRYAPSGHIYFDSRFPYYAVLKARFDKLGGWTPSVSRKIGWDG